MVLRSNVMEYNLFVTAAARGKKLVNTQCECLPI
jgi:hypothetical protein